MAGVARGERVVWITGAGSGIGAASARSAARAGWRCVLSGRRPDALARVAADVQRAGGSALALPLDVADAAAVPAARDELLRRVGRLDALVLAAGTNVRQRSWAELDPAAFAEVLATNTTAVATVLWAALPALRERGGVAVVVSSVAARRPATGAGVAYSASKSALAPLVASLNAEEAAAGVRACHLCPGDVDTDLLDRRPQPPDAAARAGMLSADDVARVVQFVLDSPSHVRLDEVVLTPR